MAEQEPLIEGEDYYFNDDGLMVLTATYLLKRGYCCDNGCKHCPYDDRSAATRAIAGSSAKNDESSD